jgi:hypothetical protein
MSGVKMLEPHWDAATAREAYRGERDAVRRSHLQVIWLLLSGEASSAVARVTGFSQRWVEKLVVRWNAEGPAGLGDQRRGNGATPVLDGAALVALAAALDEAPEDGGLERAQGGGVDVGLSGAAGRSQARAGLSAPAGVQPAMAAAPARQGGRARGAGSF